MSRSVCYLPVPVVVVGGGVVVVVVSTKMIKSFDLEFQFLVSIWGFDFDF